MFDTEKDPCTHNLTVYLVGGAVRDRLLELPVGDRDWVVTGATQKEMLQRGFRQVGKDFPVFLHPHSNEEYALARTERKTAPGYHGFEFISDPTVTLEQDLSRRDLTINAMAMDRNGGLIDPWNGHRDLRERRLTHVSAAFSEDPVRILRVARFCARFEAQRFVVADETMALMRKMVAGGEVNALVAERVWQELEKSLPLPGFYRFIEILRDCDALRILIPEVESLFGVPQVAAYHPEIDTGIHLLLSLKAAAAEQAESRVVFAVLTHDLGKGITPKEALPSHRGHENTGVPLVEAVCERFRVPRHYRQLATRVCALHLHLHRIEELKPSTIHKLIEQLDGLRQPQLVADFIVACRADKRGRAGMALSDYPQGMRLSEMFDAVRQVNTREIAADAANKGITGKAVGDAIRIAQIAAIRQAKKKEA